MADSALGTDLPKVVHIVDLNEVVINRGADDGIRQGEVFLLFNFGPDLIDPDTGKRLGTLEIVRGRGEVVHVQDHMATLRSIEVNAKAVLGRFARTGIAAAIPPAWAAGSLATSGIAAAAEGSNATGGTALLEHRLPFSGAVVGDFAKPV